MKLELKLTVKTEDSNILMKSLKPEMGDINSKRSKTSYSKDKNSFTARIKADDVNAMRAVVNSHLLWIKTFEKVIGNGNTTRN